MIFKKGYRQTAIALMLFISSGLFAQYGSYGITDARSIALGNSYNASSYQLLSLGTNPSLMAFNDFGNHAVQLMFPNATLQTHSVNSFDDFITGLTSTKPSELFKGITYEKLQTAYNGLGTINLSGLIGFLSAGYQPSQKIGYFAFSVSDYISSALTLPGALVDFHKGNSIKTTATLTDFEFRSWWLRNYSLSYARKFVTGWENGLDKIYLGASFKFIQGYGYTDVGVNGTLNLDTGNDVFLEGEYEAGLQYSFSENILGESPVDSTEVAFKYPNLKPSGTGFAIDIGSSFEFRKGVLVGLALTDLGSIHWGGNAGYHVVGGSFQIEKDITPEDIYSAFDSVYTVYENSDAFDTPTAATFRFGISFRLHKMIENFKGKLVITSDMNQALNKEAPGNYPAPRFSGGIIYHPRPKLPLVLTGLSYNPNNYMRWGFGLGYRAPFMDFYISTLDLLSFFNSVDLVSISMTVLWTINRQ